MYALEVVNGSSRLRMFCLFPDYDLLGDGDPRPLAWRTAVAHPTTRTLFTWNDEHSFVRGRAVRAGGHEMFAASGDVPPVRVSPPATVVFDGHDFRPEPPAHAGTLEVRVAEDAAVEDAARIALAVGGSPAYAVAAAPGAELSVLPAARCRVVAGLFRLGEVLESDRIADAAHVVFRSGVTAMRATLRLDNTWHVGPAR